MSRVNMANQTLAEDQWDQLTARLTIFLVVCQMGLETLTNFLELEAALLEAQDNKVLFIVLLTLKFIMKTLQLHLIWQKEDGMKLCKRMQEISKQKIKEKFKLNLKATESLWRSKRDKLKKKELWMVLIEKWIKNFSIKLELNQVMYTTLMRIKNPHLLLN